MVRHYLSLACKVLLRRKVFTLISLFGISATLVVFVIVAALLDHLFAPGAPELKLDRMLGVQRAVMYGSRNGISAGGGFRLFNRYARDLPGVERLTIFTDITTVNSFVDGRKIVTRVKRTDGAFWQVFDFTFVEGAPYLERDVSDGAFVAVIGRTARDRFGLGASAVGTRIDVGGQQFRVVGVVADVPSERTLPFSEVWVPYTTARTQDYRDQLIGNFQAVALATSPAVLPVIRAEFNSRLRRVEVPAGYDGLVAPFETRFEALAREVVPGSRRNVGSYAPQFLALLTVLGVLLALLPTVNLVNLNLSRIMERASEIGVRKACGASSRSLVLQFLLENVLLTCVGAAGAFVVAQVILAAVNRSGVIPYSQLGLSYRVFGVGFALAVVFGVLSGVYPAWRMSRLHVVAALRGHTR
jgi:putative ABC transport system permease protein